MRSSIWKNFLYFSTRDKIASVSLILILTIFTLIYVLTNNLMSIDPDEILEQETIRREFVEYEANLQPKELVSESQTEEDSLTQKNQIQTVLPNKKTNTKLTASQTIDLNAATEDILIRVPGIGKATAKKIIQYRDLLGGYVYLDQLRQIQGISNNKLITLLPFLTIIKKHRVISFYKSDIRSLENHPYINEDQLKILQELKQNKSITDIQDLSNYYQFKQSDIERLKSYIDFSNR